MFINELVGMLKEYDCKGTYVDEFASNITALLYADDVAKGGDTVKRLQDMINVLAAFCVKWGLNVNMKKTKIIVFRSGGVLKDAERWYFKQQQIDVVNWYKYLGIVFPFNLNWEKAVQTLSMQAKKALNMLQGLSNKCLGLPFTSAMYLFDRKIVPIMLYGAEVLGLQVL